MLGVIKTDVVTDLSRVHIPTPEELAENTILEVVRSGVSGIARGEKVLAI